MPPVAAPVAAPATGPVVSRVPHVVPPPPAAPPLCWFCARLAGVGGEEVTLSFHRPILFLRTTTAVVPRCVSCRAKHKSGPAAVVWGLVLGVATSVLATPCVGVPVGAVVYFVFSKVLQTGTRPLAHAREFPPVAKLLADDWVLEDE